MPYTPNELKRQKNGFVFNADKFFASIFPSGWTSKRLVSVKNDIVQETNLMAQTVSNMVSLGLKEKSDIKETIKNFTKKYGTGLADTNVSKKLPHGQNMLRNRVENDLLYENAMNMEAAYKGRKFMWLPSNAKEPRHTHMLRYGKIFEVGGTLLPSDDNFPGKAYGCKCGYKWIEEEPTEYNLLDEDNVNFYKYARAAQLAGTPKAVTALFQGIKTYSRDDLWNHFDFDVVRRSYVRSFTDPTVLESFRQLIEDNTTIKKQIRKGGILSKDLRKIKADTYNPRNYTQTPANLTLYRGGQLTKDAEKLKVGTIVHLEEPTYSAISTGDIKQFINPLKPLIYILHIKAGTRISPTMLISNYGGAEGELMIAPQSTFAVSKIYTNKKGIKIIVLESVRAVKRTKALIL